MSKAYQRQDAMRFFKLGKNRKSIQKWRRPKGKHSKMRRFRKGYPGRPNIGERTPYKEAGRINGQVPVIVYNVKDLASLNKNNVAIIARVGAKNKIEIIKKASELNIKIVNQGSKKK